MATYIGNVTITIGVSIKANSQEEADTIAAERTFGRIGDDLDNRVSQRSYTKTASLRLLQT